MEALRVLGHLEMETVPIDPDAAAANSAPPEEPEANNAEET
jgi:hypothetical protein